MAKAFKCDVCGDFYSVTHTEEDTKRTIEITKNGRDYGKKLVVHSVTLVSNTNFDFTGRLDLDLCPDCSAALIKFLENNTISKCLKHVDPVIKEKSPVVDTCIGCVYEELPSDEHPCCVCDDSRSHYREHGCTDCKYEELSAEEGPCGTCLEHSNFEPKEEDDGGL